MFSFPKLLVGFLLVAWLGYSWIFFGFKNDSMSETWLGAGLLLGGLTPIVFHPILVITSKRNYPIWLSILVNGLLIWLATKLDYFPSSEGILFGLIFAYFTLRFASKPKSISSEDIFNAEAEDRW